LLHCLVPVAATLACSTTSAQERFLIEGIFDVQAQHQAEDASAPTTGHEGIPILGRAQLWSAWQVSPGLQFYALAEWESDNSSGSRESESELEQLTLRYTSQSSHYYFIEAGKILSPLSVYSNRHLSTQNPLIGQPEMFVTSYPKGIQAAGSTGKLDYRAALVDQPDLNPDFMSHDPDLAYRPVIGLGITPVFGLRFGLSYTQGPYLNRSMVSQSLPANRWQDFKQKVAGIDAQFSRGYLEINGQLVMSEYEIPTLQAKARDQSSYLELKYTWTPRLYGAVRYERVEASAVEYSETLGWQAPQARFRKVELGIGYRLSFNTLFKATYQDTYWSSMPESITLAGGRTISMQLSHQFDVTSWLSSQWVD